MQGDDDVDSSNFSLTWECKVYQTRRISETTNRLLTSNDAKELVWPGPAHKTQLTLLPTSQRGCQSLLLAVYKGLNARGNKSGTEKKGKQ